MRSETRNTIQSLQGSSIFRFLRILVYASFLLILSEQKVSAQQWNALGPGLNGTVLDIVVFGNDVYVGGEFTDAGGLAEADYVARWDGCQWHAVGGGLNQMVYAIKEEAGIIYVGGFFTNAGGDPAADHIAKWDGSSWSAVGGGLNGPVYAIDVDGNDFYASGLFTNAGGNPSADGLAQWDGAAWNAMGSFSGIAFDIEANGSVVYIGGDFGVNPGIIDFAIWNGSSWSTLGPGITSDNGILDIEIQGSDIYVAGDFCEVGGNFNIQGIALWDGSSWNALGTGCQCWGSVGGMAIGIKNSDVYVGGWFSSTGGVPNTENLGRWDGNAWNAVGNPNLAPASSQVNTIEISGNEVYVGGWFSEIGGVPNTGNIARWGQPGNQILLTGIPDSICQDDPSITLLTTQNGFTGNWSGDGVNNNVFDPEGLLGEITLTFTPDPGQCVAPADTLIYVDFCVNPPCPIGHDAEIICALYYEESQFLNLLGAGPGGTWDPPIFDPDNLYNPCVDGEGTFDYTWSPPGCPPETDVLTIDWGWDPCDWALEDVCFNGDTISFTIPPFPGNQPAFTYDVYQCIDDFVGSNYSSEEANYFSFYYPTCIYNPNVLWIDIYWECSWGFSIPLVDIPNCSDPPCPTGNDTTYTICPYWSNNYELEHEVEYLLSGLGLPPNGSWIPPLACGDEWYSSCTDSASAYVYAHDYPGCPTVYDTAHFDYFWNPCGWSLESVCYGDDSITFTIPAYPGNSGASTYTLWVEIDAVIFDFYNLSLDSSYTLSIAWTNNPGFILMTAFLNEFPGCWWDLTINGCGYWEPIPDCDCADPPYAGENNSVIICSDTIPFDLTDLIIGNPDPGGTWSPPLASGGNLYDPLLDGSGAFTYTVTAPMCPDDNATITITVENCGTPCPGGTSSTIPVCPFWDHVNNFSALNGLPAGGVFEPPLQNPPEYNSCTDSNSVYVYPHDYPGCSTVFDTAVFDLLWNPCGWQPNPICYSDSFMTFTLSPWPGGSGTVNYILQVPGEMSYYYYPDTFQLNETETISIPLPSWYLNDPGCYDIEVVLIDAPNCSWHFGELLAWDFYAICNIPPCSCADPPNAGQNNFLSLCSDVPPFDLTTSLGANADPGGTWSPPLASGGNIYNPLVDGSGIFTYTVTSPDCPPDDASVTINVQQLAPVTLSGLPTSMCDHDPAIILATVQNGITGNWSGVGVSNNLFNPSGLNGTITLTFTPDPNQCATPATTTIDVNSPVIISISGIPDSICQAAAPVPLPAVQTGITGNWSGNGVANNTFNPNGLSGSINLVFTPNNGQCANSATTNIEVEPSIIISISNIPDSVCQNQTPIILNTQQSGVDGNWSGPGVVNNIFTPTGLSGMINLTFVPLPGVCANVANAVIFVSSLTTPVITGVPQLFCSSDPSYALPQIINNIIGTWTGSGVANNVFSPTGLNGVITLTFNPDANQCAFLSTLDVSVNPEWVPALSGVPQSLCEASGTIVLPTLQNGVSGNWSGLGVSNNNFDPAGQTGMVNLIFTPDAGQCAMPAGLNVEVTSVLTPILTGIPSMVCESDPAIFLSIVQSGITGQWSGPGVSNNVFTPSGLNGNVNLTFTPDNTFCAETATEDINVNPLVTPDLSMLPDSICQNAIPLNLPLVINGISGAWSGAGVFNNVFNPIGLNGNVQLAFTSGPNQCADNASTPITINSLVAFQNLQATCDSLANTYSVSFDISGGQPGTYTVNGIPVTGSNFISTAIDDDSISYHFIVEDKNGCNMLLIDGAKNCACATYAGTMNFNGNPMKICVGSLIGAVHNQDQVLDSDDLLSYVLHDNAGTQLGNIFSISGSLPFAVPSGIVLGQTYFISAVAGSNNGTGSIDLLDGCLSVSQGIPVVFYQPDALLNGGGSICASDCMTTQVLLSGEPPYILDYEVLVNGNPTLKSLTTDTNIIDLVICPSDYAVTSGLIEVQLTNLADFNCSLSLSSSSPVQIIVHTEVISDFISTLCQGESIVIQSTTYNESHPSGTEIFVNGSVHGCDSMVNVSLQFYPVSSFDLQETLCFGSSLMINGTQYDESNPAGTEILVNATINGCDSIVNIQLTFDSTVTTDLAMNLCQGEFVTIGGTVYNESNPIGTEVFVSAFGCDSLVNIDLTFSSIPQSEIKDTLCFGESITVNGQVYDAQHPSGNELISVLPCDSLVVVDLSFFPEVISIIRDTLKPGDSIIANGTVYNELKPTGIEVIPAGSIQGCDSTVIIDLHFRSSVLSVDFEVLSGICFGDPAVIVFNSISGGMGQYLVFVDEFHAVPVDHFPYVIGDFSPGLHFLTVEDVDSIAEKFEIFFEVTAPEQLLVDAGADQSLHQNQDALLNAQASLTNVTWSWWPPDFLSCTNCPDPMVIKPDHNITYIVQVTDDNGCTATDIISITVEQGTDIYFPNIFTPDGDGINDIVMINSSVNDLQIKSLRIFSRWGELMSEQLNVPANDPHYGWDGTYHGKEMNPGVYVWVAEVEFANGVSKVFSDEVTLIR